MGTLGAKRLIKNPLSGAPFKWRPGHVPYLPYPRYATDAMCDEVYLFDKSRW